MMKASLALAERRPDELKDAMEKLGQQAPSGRQLLMLRLMGLLIPPASAGMAARLRGILLIFLLVVALLAIGTGIVQGIGLIFGGIGLGSSVFFGFVLVVIALGVLIMFGRRRQARAQANRAAQLPGARWPQKSAVDSRRRCSRASGSSGPSSVNIATITRRMRSLRELSSSFAKAS